MVHLGKLFHVEKMCLLATVLIAHPTSAGYSWYNITSVSIIRGEDIGQLLKCMPKGLLSFCSAAQAWNWCYMLVIQAPKGWWQKD